MIATLNPKSKTQNLKWLGLRLLLLPCLIALTLANGLAQSQSVEAEHVTARLVSSVSAIQPGQPFEVALRLEIEDHWHTYYKNPGDSGLATSIQWELPEGFEAGEIQWPNPMRLSFGPLTNFGYEGTVLHVVTITPPAGAIHTSSVPRSGGPARQHPVSQATASTEVGGGAAVSGVGACPAREPAAATPRAGPSVEPRAIARAARHAHPWAPPLGFTSRSVP